MLTSISIKRRNSGRRWPMLCQMKSGSPLPSNSENWWWIALLVEFTNCFLPAMVYRIDVTRKIIRPKIKKYKVMRLARVGFQKEQKHLKCSMIFMWVTFDEFGLCRIHQCLVLWVYQILYLLFSLSNTSHHIASYWEIVKLYYVQTSSFSLEK